jgi:hypothetical protein
MLSTVEKLRTAAVVGVLGIAVTHVFELPDKLKESGVRYQGVLFIALIVGCVLLAVVATRAPARPWWTGVLAVSGVTFVAYVVSRTAGLPGGSDDIGAWGEPAGIASLLFEAFTIVVAARAITLLSAARERMPAPRPAARPRRAEPIRGQS